ncbi:MAG TPA: purine-nucleoside phosphorylase [Clostridiales bacterium]|nr:purine-nucleoside phosphorylase [Clostridiales bacterium]
MIPFEHYRQAADAVAQRFGKIPDTAIVLGSGIKSLADRLSGAKSISYRNIPNFPVTTNKNHEGRLYCGFLDGREILAFSGRCHFYEGYTFEQTAFYVRMLSLLGVKNLIITNAAGAVNSKFSVGDLMLISDHIKLCCESPVLGVHDERFGSRFFDMTSVYDIKLQQIAAQSAQKFNIDLKTGVYMFFAGPQYETPAEVRAARILGADAVGMSTVPEVISAAQVGIKVLGLSIITNMAAGMSDEPLSDEDVALQAQKALDKLCFLIADIIKSI